MIPDGTAAGAGLASARPSNTRIRGALVAESGIQRQWRRPVIERQQIFIDGQWVDPSSDEVAVVINPATELPVASIRLGSPADVDQAVAAA